jgi:protein-tyrosine sulfotransferase
MAQRISLCLIARDEEAMIAACLDSVREAVDEMIVVDTGSADRTAEIARGKGAKVVEFAWCDDFSAARNASLQAATGDWALILDADERLAPGDAHLLREAVRHGDFDCGLLPLHNAASVDADPVDVLAGAARHNEPVAMPRLLRRTPDLAYTGVIHEDVSDWIIRGGRRVRKLDAQLVHYGYTPTIWESRQKARRNLGLLERQCANTPDKPFYRAYLARELLRVDDGVRARAEIETGWGQLVAIVRGGGPRPAGVALATLRAFFQLQDGDFQGAIATATEAEAMGYDHPNLKALQGAGHEQIALDCEGGQRASHLERAARAFERALADGGRTFAEEVSPGASSWSSATRLGAVRLLQGRPAQAAAAFSSALSHQPDSLEARLGLAEARIAEGAPEQAIALLEPHIHAEQKKPDPWLLVAMACDQMGNLDEMVDLTRCARTQAPNGFVSFHRKDQLDALNTLAGLYTDEPLPVAPGWALVVSLLRREPAPAGSGAPPEAAVRQLVANLLRAGRVDLLEALFEPRAEELIPGISGWTGEVLAGFGITPEDDGEPDFVFIGGAGRSGTTLFRAMLGAHPRFHCGPEAKLVPAICALREQWWRTMGRDLEAAGVSEAALDSAVRGFVDGLMSSLGGGAPRVAEKTPHNILHAAYLGRLFPRARFVHIVRDARSVVASLLEQDWLDPSTGQRIDYCQSAEAAARYWCTMIHTARQQAQSLGGRMLEIRYEDLVTAPRESMERALAFLGEPWDEQVLRHERAGVAVSTLESSTSQIAAAVHTRSLERWRQRLSPAQAQQVELIAGPLLRELGYIKDPYAILEAV